MDGSYRRGAVVPLKENADAAVEGTPVDRARGGPATHRRGRELRGGPRRVVARRWCRTSRPSASRGADGRRGHALHPVHVGHDREAEGDRAHDRRLPDGRRRDAPDDLRHPRRRRVLVRRRHRVGHRAQLHRVRPAGQPHDGDPVRGRARTGPTRTGCGRSPRSTRRRSCTRRRPPSARSCGGGREHPEKHDLSSLRLLGSVGEPINPEAWVWYWKYIGGERCPVVDTWWQTETGSILITPLPGITTLKPGSATRPFPGIEADVYDEKGQSVPAGRRRVPGAEAAVAVDVPHDLRRPRPLRRHVLLAVRGGHVPRRRRRQARRGRLLLAARPDRRRDERGRPPDLHVRGRVGAGRQRACRRSRGGRARPIRTSGRRSWPT